MGAFSDNLDFMKIVFPLQREHCFSGSEGSDFDDFWVIFSMLLKKQNEQGKIIDGIGTRSAAPAGATTRTGT